MRDVTPNQHTIEAVIVALKAQYSAVNVNYKTNDSKSELDSHANMIVLGEDCFIFESTGKTCNVEPFSTELGIAQDIAVVDAALTYDCPLSHETYLLIIRNALHIESTNHNLFYHARR